MRRLAWIASLLVACGGGGGGDGGGGDGGDGGSSAPSLWVMGYYAGWEQWRLPPGQLDLDGLTHVIHFSIGVRPDGTLRTGPDWNDMTDAHIDETVAAVHAWGLPVLLCVGSEDTHADFAPAIADAATRARLADALVAFADSRGYDGIDMDMEPVEDADVAPLTSLLTELRARLDALGGRHRLLTAAVAWHVEAFAAAGDALDRVNLMTYEVSGPWDGWVTWHTAPIENGGATFPSSGGSLPSAALRVDEALAAGVPVSRLGIGVTFGGAVWTGGVTAPRQEWPAGSPPAVRDVPYHELAATYAGTPLEWDAAARVAWIGIDMPGTASDQFVSLDDGRSCAEAVVFARERSLGSIIIWQLGDGFVDAPGTADPHPLLHAMRDALAR